MQTAISPGLTLFEAMRNAGSVPVMGQAAQPGPKPAMTSQTISARVNEDATLRLGPEAGGVSARPSTDQSLGGETRVWTTTTGDGDTIYHADVRGGAASAPA